MELCHGQLFYLLVKCFKDFEFFFRNQKTNHQRPLWQGLKPSLLHSSGPRRWLESVTHCQDILPGEKPAFTGLMILKLNQLDIYTYVIIDAVCQTISIDQSVQSCKLASQNSFFLICKIFWQIVNRYRWIAFCLS